MNDKQTRARLIRAEVQNVLGVRLAEVSFAPSGGLTVVGGANGAGKSSLLDAIRWAIDGVKPKGKELLRHGADKGFVQLELAGEVVEIRRGVTERGTTVRITGADGADLKKPQGVLDGLVGAFGVDPTAFLLLSDEAQAKRVQEVMGVDFADLDAERKRLFEARADANRRVRDAEGELRALPPAEPCAPVDAAALLRQIADAEALERQDAADARDLDALRKRRDEVTARLEEAQRAVVALTAERDQVIADGKALRARCDARKVEAQAAEAAGQTVARLRGQLADVEAINARAAAYQRREDARWRLRDLEAAAKAAEDAVAAVDAQRAARIAAAGTPIDGIAIVDGAVHWQGRPLAEASDGQRLRAAFEIAAAGAPDLRVLFLRHGALLDDAARQAVSDLAQDRGYTVILETVGTAGIDVLVEDGVTR
jgi:DNA repair exonuclease SbcCD ATPase subunit